MGTQWELRWHRVDFITPFRLRQIWIPGELTRNRLKQQNYWCWNLNKYSVGKTCFLLLCFQEWINSINTINSWISLETQISKHQHTSNIHPAFDMVHPAFDMVPEPFWESPVPNRIHSCGESSPMLWWECSYSSSSAKRKQIWNHQRLGLIPSTVQTIRLKRIFVRLRAGLEHPHPSATNPLYTLLCYTTVLLLWQWDKLLTHW